MHALQLCERGEVRVTFFLVDPARDGCAMAAADQAAAAVQAACYGGGCCGRQPIMACNQWKEVARADRRSRSWAVEDTRAIARAVCVAPHQAARRRTDERQHYKARSTHDPM